MVKGLYTAYTGMINEQRRLDTLTNNLANSNTTGYKKEGATAQAFDAALAIKIKDTSSGNLPKNIGYINMGVDIGETYTDYSQGSFKITDKSSDLAINGNGFFAIEFTDKQGNTSIKYTRDGEFTVNKDGYFVTADGDYLLNANAAMNGQTGDAAHIRIDPLQDYVVDAQGQVYQNGQVVATIGLVDFTNYDYLSKYGENLYEPVEGATLVASDATLEQGCLEMANVNIVDEMVSMITIQRAYEAGQKMIQTEDSTLEMAVSQVGRV